MISKEKLLNLGFAEKLCEETLKNKKLSAQLAADLLEAKVDEVEKSVGVTFYQFAAKVAGDETPAEARKLILGYIRDGKISSSKQVEAVAKYFKKCTSFDKKAFDKDCGVGVVTSSKQIKATVDAIFKKNAAAIKQNRYTGVMKYLGQINAQLKWADGAEVKSTFDAAVLAALGPKTEADKQQKGKAKKANKGSQKKQSVKKEDVKEEKKEDQELLLEGRFIPAARNTEEQLAAHMAATGGKVMTRFPPEPNGFLHIGHAKAMNFNFGIAEKHGGHCYLRFDDTNPAAEKQLYIDSIEENVRWMGYKPYKITYSSDYFQQLYDLAVKLIKLDLAYVCHQTKAEIEQYRAEKKDSPWRNRPVEESLRMFNNMRRGMYEEGSVSLRMKGDMQASNPQMWDMIAYRIIYREHPHAKDGWCIYPSYDYSHCIVDSLENITHSLCTLEFEVRRETYFKLLWDLDLYKPKVWEYSRLNVDHNVLSKRRLLRLVNEGHVRGWDDPRLLTIAGLRRRGYTAQAIKNFCDNVGVSRNENAQPISRLEHFVREALHPISRRCFVVLDPIKVTLTNYPAGKVEQLHAPNFPPPEDKATHKMSFSRVVYIDRSDFREQDSKDFFGLAPGKEVFLKFAYNMKCDKVIKNASGKVTELECSVNLDKKAKMAKGKITWVAERKPGQEPLKIEVRQYDVLFTAKEPMKDKTYADWLDGVNKNSEKVIMAYADESVNNANSGDRFQFERLGYYVCDQDTTPALKVFNSTCPLKVKQSNKA